MRCGRRSTLLDTLHADKNARDRVPNAENNRDSDGEHDEKVNTAADRSPSTTITFQKTSGTITVLGLEKRILQMIAQGESDDGVQTPTAEKARGGRFAMRCVIEHEVVKTVVCLTSRAKLPLVWTDGNVLGKMTDSRTATNCSVIFEHPQARRLDRYLVAPQCDMRAVTVEEKSIIWVHVKPMDENGRQDRWTPVKAPLRRSTATKTPANTSRPSSIRYRQC